MFFAQMVHPKIGMLRTTSNFTPRFAAGEEYLLLWARRGVTLCIPQGVTLCKKKTQLQNPAKSGGLGPPRCSKRRAA